MIHGTRRRAARKRVANIPTLKAIVRIFGKGLSLRKAQFGNPRKNLSRVILLSGYVLQLDQIVST